MCVSERESSSEVLLTPRAPWESAMNIHGAVALFSLHRPGHRMPPLELRGPVVNISKIRFSRGSLRGFRLKCPRRLLSSAVGRGRPAGSGTGASWKPAVGGLVLAELPERPGDIGLALLTSSCPLERGSR